MVVFLISLINILNQNIFITMVYYWKNDKIE